MSANVRCAGRVFAHSASTLQPEIVEHRVPCGWKGERFAEAATDPTLPPKERIKDWWPRTAALRTAKPCPRCGGKVELIPPPPDPWQEP